MTKEYICDLTDDNIRKMLGENDIPADVVELLMEYRKYCGTMSYYNASEGAMWERERSARQMADATLREVFAQIPKEYKKAIRTMEQGQLLL